MLRSRARVIAAATLVVAASAWTAAGAEPARAPQGAPARVSAAAPGDAPLAAIRFAPGSADLAAPPAALEGLVAWSGRHPEALVVVAGHVTPGEADAAAGERLALRRARAIRGALVDAGLAEAQVVVAGYGARVPGAGAEARVWSGGERPAATARAARPRPGAVARR